MSGVSRSHVVALSGGVGGAKLALGLSRCVDACDLTIVANTADDFEHLGLYISPDVDTVLYTLAGISNQEQGWGLADESWQCMTRLAQLGGESWFRLGDRDIALHLQRSQMLKQMGATLTGVTEYLSRALSVAATILPMCDQSVATIVQTQQGDMPFQHYFVREHCNPAVTGFRFAGIEQAQINPRLIERCAQAAARCIVLCPSNPYVSLAPMLNIAGMREFLRSQSAPVIAVSPIVGGGALKGPAAKMMQELNVQPSVLTVAQMYRGFVDGLVVDVVDAASADAIADLGITPMVTQTVMRTLDDREKLARDVLDFAQRLAA
jgi:LPPG:FO 2-phospho-L-lactate transferase